MAIRFEARQGADRWRPRLLTALGLWLLFLTARGYHRHPGRLGGILFLAGAGIALACFGEPDFDSGAGRAALMALRNAVVLGGLGAMVQFILEYVHPGHRAHWIYAPMAAYWLVLDWRLLAPGAAGLAGVAGILGGVLLVLSLALVLVAITRTWIRGRKRNMPPGIGLVFHVTVGGFAMLLAAATAQRLWNLPWLVDAAGAVLLLAAAWAWSRAASAA